MACAKDYPELQARKARIIPLCCRGKYRTKDAARDIGCTQSAVSCMKARYRRLGDKAFVNGHTGLKLPYRKYNESLRKRVTEIYKSDFFTMNFKAFRDTLKDFFGIEISIKALTKILNENGFISPNARISKKEKKKHLPRNERETSGELLQLDASLHDWFMTGEKVTLHGAVDDATHKITGLYFCKNECRLGYAEVKRQTFLRYGVEKADYIDRHSAFVTNPRKDGKTLEECLDEAKKSDTYWLNLNKQFNTEIILALSAQAKGRIERMWQTLQGRLPFIFRYLGIKDMESANAYLKEYYIDDFNARFSVAPQKDESSFRPLTESEKESLDYILSVKFDKSTKADGTFVFHGFTFHLDSAFTACKKFELCLSESFGIKAFMGGKMYDVSLVDEWQECVDDKMPRVEKDLVEKYLLSDTRVKLFKAG